MLGRIIGFFSCALCALAFWGIAASGKNGKAPISFWTGDNSLKEKIHDVKAYNEKMAALYTKYAFSYLASGISFLFSSDPWRCDFVPFDNGWNLSCVQAV